MPTRQREAVDPDAPVLRRLAARMALGGLVSAVVKVEQFLAFTGALGGEFRANIFPPVTIVADIMAGGAMAAKLGGIPKQIKARMDAGGAMLADIAGLAQIELMATMAGGGAMRAELGPKELGAVMSGGGTMSMSGALRRRLRATMALGGDVTADLVRTVHIGADMSGGGAAEAGIAQPPAGLSFVGAGAIAGGSGDVSVSAHANTQVGDLLVVVIASNGTAANTPSGWSQPTSTGISNTPGHIRYKTRVATEAGSGGTNTVLLADAGTYQIAQILTLRNAGALRDGGRDFAAGAGTTFPLTSYTPATTLGELAVTAYASPNNTGTISLTANANYDNETITGQLTNASLSLAVAVSKANSTGSFAAPSASCVNSVSNRLYESVLVAAP
jgi:hypothetical protein